MGCNYYLRYNKCECCNRSDELFHIGKSSYGWQFSFQCVNQRVDMSKLDKVYAIAGVESELVDIKTFSKLKLFLDTYVRDYKTAFIQDEEGRTVDLENFYSLVFSSKNGKNHYDETTDSHSDHFAGSSYTHSVWKDKDGWTFSLTDFS